MGLEEKEQTREIGGFRYAVIPLPFGVGQTALVRFVKIVSPVLAAAFRNGTDTKDPSFLAGIFEAIPTAIGESDLQWFAKTFGDASYVEIDGRRVPLLKDTQELHFAGRYMEYFQWLAFCLEVNFAGFFGGMQKGGGIGGVLHMMKQPSP